MNFETILNNLSDMSTIICLILALDARKSQSIEHGSGNTNFSMFLDFKSINWILM